jgi:hypothetical protein
VTRRKPGPEPRFDPDTARARRYEQNYRGQLIAREIMSYLEVRHPRIFREAKAHAEEFITTQRGPLPGDAQLTENP